MWKGGLLLLCRMPVVGYDEHLLVFKISFLTLPFGIIFSKPSRLLTTGLLGCACDYSWRNGSRIEGRKGLAKAFDSWQFLGKPKTGSR